MICDLESFQRGCLAQTMCPIALYNQQKIGKILRAVWKKKQKNPWKWDTYSTLIQHLIFFHKGNLAHTMRTIYNYIDYVILYNRAKVPSLEVPQSHFGEKAKKPQKNGQLIQYNLELMFFLKKRIQFRRYTLLSSTTMQKLGKILKS